MKAKYCARLVGGLLAGAAAIAAASYATYAGISWYRYGRTKREVSGEESDSLLDLYMPECEVADRHRIRVSAPTEVTFGAACEMEYVSAGDCQSNFQDARDSSRLLCSYGQR